MKVSRDFLLHMRNLHFGKPQLMTLVFRDQFSLEVKAGKKHALLSTRASVCSYKMPMIELNLFLFTPWLSGNSDLQKILKAFATSGMHVLL